MSILVLDCVKGTKFNTNMNVRFWHKADTRQTILILKKRSISFDYVLTIKNIKATIILSISVFIAIYQSKEKIHGKGGSLEWRGYRICK